MGNIRARVPPNGLRAGTPVELPTSGNQFGDLVKQSFIRLVECADLMAVNIDLPKHFPVSPNKDYDFRPRLQAAGQVILQGPDIFDQNVSVFFDGGSANSHADWDIRMLGWCADKLIKDQFA